MRVSASLRASASRGAARSKVVVIQAPEGDAPSREFYLFEQRAPPATPLRRAWGRTADDVEEELVADIRASIAYPPWEDGRPVAGLPEMRAVVDDAGRAYLVGEVEWPESTPMDHGRLWRGFTSAEKAELRNLWSYLRRPVA